MSTNDTNTVADVKAIAAEALAALDVGHQVPPFSTRVAAFNLKDAYLVAAAIRQLRETRGETPVGRKIGFTNRTIWAEYNVYGPICGYVYNCTVHDLAGIGDSFSLAGFAEPRIEPEIVFGLADAPSPDMDEGALLACIDWVAHGFEIVQSIFPGWVFSAPDTVAGFGTPRGPFGWTSSFNRSARRGLEPDTFELRNRSQARRHNRRSRSRYECVGWTRIGTASSRGYSRARPDQPVIGARRDCHDGNSDACASGVSRRHLGDRIDGRRA
jgi:hypothetical protein